VDVNGPLLSFRLGEVQYQMTIVKEKNLIFVHSPETGNIALVKKDRFPLKAKANMEGGYGAPMPSQIIKIMVQPGQGD